jgi:hypothetical protein
VEYYIGNNAGEVGRKLLDTNFSGTVLQGVPETDGDSATGIVVAPDGRSFTANELPTSDEQVSDVAETVNKYSLGDQATVFLVESADYRNLHICPPGTPMRDFYYFYTITPKPHQIHLWRLPETYTVVK